MSEIWPTEIRLSADKIALCITFDDGSHHDLPAELLRVMSPSAEVQGHSPSERKTVPGKRLVTITKIEPVGHYAIRIVFSDRHDSGIYTWPYLRELGLGLDEKWASYLGELAAQGLSRD